MHYGLKAYVLITIIKLSSLKGLFLWSRQSRESSLSELAIQSYDIHICVCCFCSVPTSISYASFNDRTDSVITLRSAGMSFQRPFSSLLRWLVFYLHSVCRCRRPEGLWKTSFGLIYLGLSHRMWLGEPTALVSLRRIQQSTMAMLRHNVTILVVETDAL